MAKTLMIVGAGAEQVPAYERAKARNLTVVGTDMDPRAPGLALADHSLIVSTRDANETARRALEFHQSHRIDGVMTIANDVPYTVAMVASELGLRGISLEAARKVSDKLLMKESFMEHGVECPWFVKIRDANELWEYLRAESGERFVLKPVDGRGARGVLLIDDSIDAEWAVDESRRWGESGRLILEKFVPGMQLSTESFLLNGKCFTPAIAERNYARLEQFKPNIIEDGGTIPAPIGETMREVVDDLILRGAAALGIRDGIIKGDLIIDEHGHAVVVELAARLSGGWLATHQIPAATGVDLVSAVMEYALGGHVDEDELRATRHGATAIRYWYPKEGMIKKISGEDCVKVAPGLVTYGFFRAPGEIQPKIKMHPDRFGFAIVEGKSRDEVLARITHAMDCVEIEVDS